MDDDMVCNECVTCGTMEIGLADDLADRWCYHWSKEGDADKHLEVPKGKEGFYCKDHCPSNSRRSA